MSSNDCPDPLICRTCSSSNVNVMTKRDEKILHVSTDPRIVDRLWECFDKMSTIGEGAFGKVYHVKRKASERIAEETDRGTDGGDTLIQQPAPAQKTEYAVKKQVVYSGEWDDTLIREFTALSCLSSSSCNSTSTASIGTVSHHHCPYIVPFYGLGICTENQAHLMYFELAQGDLSEWMGVGWPDGLLKRYMWQLLTALEYCHSHLFIHGDIKPANILVQGGNIMLADFGHSQRYSVRRNKKYTLMIQTPGYKAPEIICENDKYTTAVDVWNMGVVFFEMLSGIPLFGNGMSASPLNDIFQIVGSPSEETWSVLLPKGMKREELGCATDLTSSSSSTTLYPSSCFTDFMKTTLMEPLCDNLNDQDKTHLTDLLSKMLTVNPHMRISAKEALSHPFFTSDTFPTIASLKPTGTLPTNPNPFCLAPAAHLPAILENLLWHESAVIPPRYISHHVNLTVDMRDNLVDWLIQVSKKYKLSQPCLFRAVRILDGFLVQTRDHIPVEDVQRIGIAALWVSTKLEEPDETEMSEFTEQQLAKTQIDILSNVKPDDLYGPLYLDYVHYLEDILSNQERKQWTKETRYLTRYILESIVVGGTEMLQKWGHTTLQISAAAHVLALYCCTNTANREEPSKETIAAAVVKGPVSAYILCISEAFGAVPRCDIDTLQQAVIHVANVVSKRRESSLQSVREKYDKAKYNSVARQWPFALSTEDFLTL